MFFFYRDLHIEGNGTKSVLTFIPVPESNGSKLKCRAKNPKLVNSAIEDLLTLDIKCETNFLFEQNIALNTNVLQYLRFTFVEVFVINT